jgi:VanZ family protein
VTHILLRLAWLGYGVLLTGMLLTPYPAHVVGLEERPHFPWGETGIHTIAFIGLSLFAHIAWRPTRSTSWLLIVLLAAYGVSMELLQHFFPPRSVRLVDASENLIGIAVGAMIYAGICIRYRRSLRPASQHRSAPPSDRAT